MVSTDYWPVSNNGQIYRVSKIDIRVLEKDLTQSFRHSKAKNQKSVGLLRATVNPKKIFSVYKKDQILDLTAQENALR